MTITMIVCLVLISPIVLWIISRIIWKAYFKSYFEMLRKHTDILENESNEKKREAQEQLKNAVKHFGKPKSVD